MKQLFVILALSLASAASKAESCQSLVALAASQPGLTTLVAAVKAAGLVDTLNAPGPITVFAPVNSAFAKIPNNTLQDLLKPENRLQLRSILAAHIVIGKEITSSWIQNNYGTSGVIEVANGGVQLVGEGDSGSTIGGASFITTDIQACNGIVHLIDTVLTPN